MPVFAIALLFLSASMHALWNFLLKSSQEKYIAMGWQVILSGTFSLIFIFFTGLPPHSMWIFAIISMMLEAVYFILLCVAYTSHDFSLVYPIARGAAPAHVEPPPRYWCCGLRSFCMKDSQLPDMLA